jgi:hypothetical protein
MNHYSVVLAERDAAYARYFPMLTKRRRNILKRINENLGFNVLEKRDGWLPRGISEYRDIVRRMSTRTLEMALDEFSGEDDHSMILFLETADRYYQDEEMLLRFVLSYGDAIRSVLSDADANTMWTNPYYFNLSLRNVFRTSKAAHREFFRYEDQSAMPSETRAQFEAIVTVLAKNFYGAQRGYEPRMPSKLVELLMEQPELAHDILAYQEDRNIALSQIGVKGFIEYLNAPVTSLRSGIL